MASLVPTYILAPNWDILASSSIVVLGHMITDRKNPESQARPALSILLTPRKYKKERKSTGRPRPISCAPERLASSSNTFNWEEGKCFEESKEELDINRKIEANIVPEGPAVTLGPSGEWKATDKRDIKYKGSSDYIFAYKLLMFKPKKKGELGASTKTITRRAVFGRHKDNVVKSLENALDIKYNKGDLGILKDVSEEAKDEE
ncbi:hypothetical protein BKA61DRAFT_683196 [Leptodontidium sp. MPI-SDFR-AT-0119]|nr:hypothetical protein BKA61DRAFT_683196 [Leptodontidium sp. MPI-SDFR-AT-0119]